MTVVKLSNVFKNYKQGVTTVPVLKNISMEVEEGEYNAIMGPSGSGKSTLMNILGCLDTPTSGSYEFDGQDISGLDDAALALIRNKSIGFVFQEFHLLQEYDALDNVALPLLYAGVSKTERRERAAEALKRVDLTDRLSFRPHQLSGGQQQRVAIARAIVHDPRLLLADEPTGALDSVAGMQLMDILDELHKSGTTILVITHERTVAERSRRILYLRDGEISGGARRRELQ